MDFKAINHWIWNMSLVIFNLLVCGLVLGDLLLISWESVQDVWRYRRHRLSRRKGRKPKETDQAELGLE